MCGCGVSSIPVVDGQVHHFGARGLYNGGLLIGDRESGSFWQHLTGKCLHGPLRGRQLEVFPLLHLTAGQALDAYPNAELARSRLSFAQRFIRRGQETTLWLLNGRLPPGFQWTMGEEDTRLPRMERGLAVWTDRTQRFYPLKALRAHDNALIDADSLESGDSRPSGGQALLVYLDPLSGTPACLRTDATTCNWSADRLVLEGGTYIRGAVAYDAQGTVQPADRPRQSLTCWYGYALTFPGGEIYDD